jgi:hypothetical protein
VERGRPRVDEQDEQHDQHQDDAEDPIHDAAFLFERDARAAREDQIPDVIDSAGGAGSRER